MFGFDFFEILLSLGRFDSIAEYTTPNSCLAERISFGTLFIKSFVWVVCWHVYRLRACIFFFPSFLCYEI